MDPLKIKAARLGQFQQPLKTRLTLILNFTRPNAITYTNRPKFFGLSLRQNRSRARRKEKGDPFSL